MQNGPHVFKVDVRYGITHNIRDHSMLHVRRPQNKGGWVLGRGGPNKLFPQKNVLPEMAQEEEKKVKQNIFLAHIQNPSQMF